MQKNLIYLEIEIEGIIAMSKKTYVLGQVDGHIDKPFVLKWGVKHDSHHVDDGHTNVFADTALNSCDNFSDVMPLGETIESTTPSNGDSGELADTTF